MSREQVASLQEESLDLERAANHLLGDVHDPDLGVKLSDGRTLRQAVHDLAEHYEEHVEQLLWTKWGQHIERSEAKVLLAKLQGARASFTAYLSDMDDANLGVVGNVAAHNATAQEVVGHVVEEERRTMSLIAQALAGRSGERP